MKKRSVSFLFALSLILVNSISQVSAIQYYVNSKTGNDSNTGTSFKEPWKSLAPVNERIFQPGDIINFANGSVWNETLNISGNGMEGKPIIYRAYGNGSKPVISTSSHVKFDSAFYMNLRQYQELNIETSAKYSIIISGKWNIVEGFLVRDALFAGIELTKGADYNIVRYCELTNTGIGISIRGRYNLITNNYVHDLVMIRDTPATVNNNDDYGAVAFWIWSASKNEISYNKAVNCVAHSYDYEVDGGFVEFSGTVDSTYVHHNWAENCDDIIEVGGRQRKYNNKFAYNIFLDCGRFGFEFHMHVPGLPLKNFTIENNVIVNVMKYSVDRDGTKFPVAFGFWDEGIPDSSTVIVKNNIFYIPNAAGITNKAGFAHCNNLYFLGGKKNAGFILDRSEKIADPHFVNVSQKDFHLLPGSPAINKGLDLGYTVDLDGNKVPAEHAPDMGAYEFGSSPLSSGQKATNSTSFQNSYVKVSAENPFYFELTNGDTYIPIGANLCWAKDIDTLESYFKKLAENGGNFARIWLNFPGQEIETEYGKADETNAKNLDRILEMAVKYNIKIKLCIESFRQISPAKNFFSKTQYHKEFGGPFENMDEYINTEKGRQVYLNRLEMLRKRFGDNPAIFGWELWNEMNAIESEGLREWNEYMLPKVHAMFPKNMVLQSLGSFDHEGTRNDYRYINRMQSNDVAQIHRYLDLGASLDICKAPMDMLAGNAIDELRSYQITKPMLLAEVGGVKPKHTGPIELYEKDKEGILLHDLLFAPFFSGAAGPGHAWHWDSYIDKNNLWYHFQRFGIAIKGIDPVKEKFIPVKIPHSKLRIYGLIGNKTIILWCRDIENDWENELVKGVSPATLSGLSVDVSSLLANNAIKTITTYDPWKNEWTKEKKESLIVIPEFKRSVVVRIEKK